MPENDVPMVDERQTLISGFYGSNFISIEKLTRLLFFA